MDKNGNTHGDWVLYRAGIWGGSPLYLSPVLASDLLNERVEQEKQEQRDRHDKHVAERDEKERTDKEEASAKEIVDAPQRRLLQSSHPHEVLRHPVLVDPAGLDARIDRLCAGLYGGDNDHVGREIRALKAAQVRGPYRSIVRSQQWRKELEALADEMPAFREAVNVVVRAWAISEATKVEPTVPPMLLVGPPGVGKSYFCRRLAETMGTGLGWMGLDQSTAGTDLRGTHSTWSTARHGLLFELLGLGSTANPLVVLDEIDKAARDFGTNGVDMLAQLHGVLEQETARHMVDVSLNIEFDASQVMYIATANTLDRIEAPLLSRFEVISVGLPAPHERRESAARVVETTLARLGVRGAIRVRAGSYVVLADFSPRVIRKAVERSVGDAVIQGRTELDATDFEVALGIGTAPRQGTTH